MLAIIARSSTYVAKLPCIVNGLRVYPKLSLCEHLLRGSMNKINKQGLKMSLCMVSFCLCVDSVFPKYSPENMVVNLV